MLVVVVLVVTSMLTPNNTIIQHDYDALLSPLYHNNNKTQVDGRWWPWTAFPAA